MKKIFLLCMAGALAMAATACDDDKGGGNSAKMTVNGRTEPVKSAFYALTENAFELVLLKDAFTTMPTEPEYYLSIIGSKSIYGKTLDLTQPLENSHLDLIAKNSKRVSIYYYNGRIDIAEGGSVTAGTLHITQNGDNFTIKVSVTLSDGYSFSANWQGTATQVHI